MNKKIVFAVVVCLLFMAACAHKFDREEFRKKVMAKKHERMLRMVNKPDGVVRKPAPVMLKKMMNNPHHHQHDIKDRKMKHDHTKSRGDHHMTTLTSNTLTEKNIIWGELFSIEVPDGQSLAVQIVRTSNIYRADDGRYPTLTLCRPEARSCVNDDNGRSLSFEVDAATLKKYFRKSHTFDFTLSTSRSSTTGVAVGVYACVGKNASLETCHTPVNINCYHGKASDVMNVCICDKGYTGKNCGKYAESAPPVWEMDSTFDDVENVFGMVCCIVFNALFFAFLIVTVVCCVCVRCCTRARRQTVVNQPVAVPAVQPIVQPVMPAYYPGGYRPLSVVPPPPPPLMPRPQFQPQPQYRPQPQPQYRPQPQPQYRPQPQPQPQTHRYNPYEDIELNTLPARNPNPAVVMPPLAPVKQVPVFVRPPPAPRN